MWSCNPTPGKIAGKDENSNSKRYTYPNIHSSTIYNNWDMEAKYLSTWILHRARTNNFTICMEIQKTSNSQSNLEKEKWTWRNQPAWLQALLQSHSHQESMVLAQRQKYRSMELNRKSRDKSTHLWTPYLWQRRQEYTMEKRQCIKQVVLGKLVNHL